jgi:RNA polymerase sigma factor (sigma-70 family)
MSSDYSRTSGGIDYWTDIESAGASYGECTLQDLTKFYQANRPGLFSRALALVRDRAAAEDLLQETFLRLVEEAGRGAKILSVLKWTHVVLKNLALNHLEHTRVASRVIHADVSPDDVCVPHRDTSAEQRLITEERQAALGHALTRLRPLERECLLLFAQGWSYRQIADEKKISPATAVCCVRRGMRRMRNEMSAEGSK